MPCRTLRCSLPSTSSVGKVAVIRVAALLASGLILSGCSSWQAQHEPLAQVIAEKRPERIRMVTADGRRHELRRPVVEGDSLMGNPPIRTRASVQGPPRTLPVITQRFALSEVREYRLREPDVGRSAGLILLLGTGLLAGFVVAAYAAAGPS